MFESAQERALNGLYSTPWDFGGSGAQGGSYTSYTHAASPGVSTCIPTSPHSRSGLLNDSDGPGVDQDMCGPGDVLLAAAGPGPVEVLGGHLQGCGHQGAGHLPATSPTAGGESHPFGVFNKPAAGSPAAGGVLSHPLACSARRSGAALPQAPLTLSGAAWRCSTRGQPPRAQLFTTPQRI